MGKGSRSRNERAGDIFANPDKVSQKKAGKSNLSTKLGVAAVALLLVGCFALWGFTSWVPRISTVAKSDNFKVSGSVMTYFVTMQKNQFITTAQNYGLLSYYGIDANRTSLEELRSQKYSETESWYDYFVNQTKDTVENLLVLCEAAKKAGITLDADDMKNIDDTIKLQKESAAQLAVYYASQGYTGYDANFFLQQEYGNGVSERDVRKAMELSTLSSKFYETKKTELEGNITDADIQKYYDDNPSGFLTADCYNYSFVANLTPAGSSATDEEKAKFETDKENAKKLADELAACKTKDEFVKKATDYILGTYAENQFDVRYAAKKSSIAADAIPGAVKLEEDKAAIVKYVADKIADPSLSAPEAADSSDSYGKALDSVRSSVLSDVQSAYNSVKETASSAYADPNAENAREIDKWMFASDRKAGDTKVISDEAEQKATYSVYFMDKEAHRDDSVTKNVNHILFKTESYENAEAAKKKAEEVLAQYKAGTMNEEEFLKLADANNEDGSNTYTNVKDGEMVTNFNDWLFDSARKEGDVEVVETEYGAHIMYFKGDGEIAWRSDAKNGVFNERYDSWLTAEKEVAKVNFNARLLNSVGN